MKLLKSLLIFLAPIAAVVSGCSKGRNCELAIYYKAETVNLKATYVECDSFQMISNTEVYVWIDSTKMHVFSEIHIAPNCK